jgi:hypothetical protein
VFCEEQLVVKGSISMQRSKIYLAIVFHVFAVLQFSLGWLHDLLSSVFEWSGLIFGTNGFISCIRILVQTLCETSSARFLGRAFC